MSVTIPEIGGIPFGGTSLPCIVTVANGPDIGFELILNTKKEYKGITLTHTQLNFTSGVTEQQFLVYFSDIGAAQAEGITSGGIDIKMGGINAEFYTLSTSSLTFNITTQQVEVPSVITVTNDYIAKTYVNLTLQTSEPCAVYYEVSLLYTSLPVFNLTKNQTMPANNTMRSAYGASYVFSSTQTTSYLTTFQIPDLEPEITYSLYIFLESNGGRHMDIPYNHTFSTKDRDNAADVSIRLKQSYISQIDKRNILEAIGLILSLGETVFF